jgi:hypothetical protein
MMATDDWQTIPLGQALTFQRGFDITKSEQRLGPYPVFSSSGAKSTHSNYMVRGPGVIIGRKGSLGTVFYSEGDYWPHDTALWVKTSTAITQSLPITSFKQWVLSATMWVLQIQH